MTTAIAERKAFSIEPITYPVIAEKIGELAAEYLPLRVNGLDDSKGLKRVHDARMVVKNLRVNVDKRRKELKESALKYGREVDSAAKQLFDLLEPIETHLQDEEDRFENEKKRIKAEAEEAKRVKLQKRLDDLLAFGFVGNPANVDAMTDEAHAFHLSTVKLAYDAKVKAEAEAAAQRKAEEARLAAERAELDRLRKEQEAEAARLRAEQKRLDDEAAAQRRAVELETAKREAAEKARIEAEQRIAREQEQARLAAEQQAARMKAEGEARAAAKAKAEAERPYREKIIAVADAIDEIVIPDGPKFDEVLEVVGRAALKVRAIADGPLS
jgi:DNA repair exonuclease SbcCD ATPase subunit